MKSLLLTGLLLLFCITGKAFSSSLIDSLIGIAQSLHYSAPVKADSLYRVILPEAQKTGYQEGIAYCYKGLGIISDVQGKPEASLGLYKMAFSIFMELGDTMNAYKVKYNEGLIYNQMKKYELAKETLAECNKIFTLFDFKPGVIMCKQNLGVSYFYQDKFEEALEIFLETERKAREIGYVDHNTYGNIGNAYYGLKQYDSARYYFEYAIEMTKNEGINWGLAAFGTNLAICYMEQKKYDKAIEVAGETLIIATENGIQDNIATLNLVLSDAHEKKGDYKQSLDYYKAGRRFLDSLDRAAFILELDQSEAILENEKSKSEIALLREQEKRSDLERENDQLTKQALSLVVGLAALIVVLLYFQGRKRKTMNRQLRLKNHKIVEQNKEITDSINYARQIQSALLSGESEWEKISPEHFVWLKPKDVVSGDFFWAFHSDETNVSVWVAADCTGHGVPGAFMSMLGISFLNEIVVENGIIDPAQILNTLRLKIIKALVQKNALRQRRDGIDLALCVWDKNRNLLHFAGANNPLYIVRQKELLKPEDEASVKAASDQKVLLEIEPNKMPVGNYTEELHDFASQTIVLAPGDRIYSFSDGMPDQFGGTEGKKFKYKPFRELLLQISGLEMKAQARKLDDSFETWRGEIEQIDDVCVIGVRVR